MEGPWTRTGALAGVGAFLVGVLALVVAVLAWTLPRQPAASQSTGSSTDRLDVRVPPSSYDVTASWWHNHGPIYEADSGLHSDYGVTHAHAYGNAVGRFVYRVTLGEFAGERVELGARLSADTHGYHDPENRHTDVTVIVNGVRLPVRSVAPDDGRGTRYRWWFDASVLRRGQNTVEFAVEESAALPNGLAIYGAAIAAGEADEHITLRSE
ncbi:hypothetical protein [Saccharothrix sp. HUAS TT1]|uniref:hypothetical protein n=1 Tax=unclassified Saccharothrix TaxID=2593673 RepID=UPI00345B8072